MKHSTSVRGLGILLLAAAVAGCKTTAPRGRGKLCIDVYGKGARDAAAQVYVDGAKECDVSMTKGKGFFVFCPAGTHMIKVEAEGFEPYEHEIKVHANATKWLNIRLMKAEPEQEKPAEEKPEEEPADK